MSEVLSTGKSSFKIEVPYKLIETGEKGKKPLIVYLHGYNQNIKYFRRKVKGLTDLRAYHLFIQAPYPIYDREHKRKVPEWGRAWYLYDGDQQQFIKSLELASEFVQEVIDNILNHIDVNRLAMIGYSMGGYLAGYFALSRWKHVNDLVVIGGRIKTEIFEQKAGNYDHMNVLALHGSKDDSVKSEPQQKSAEQLKEMGAKVTYRELVEGHDLNKPYVTETIEWMKSLGYEESSGI